MTQHTPRIALVGDRSANVRAHARIPVIIDALLGREGIALDPYWIATSDVSACDLAGFDAIWLMPGSPYINADGALAAVKTAREQEIPFLGTCGGFQHALLEYARNVAGLPDADHAESNPDAATAVIAPLACSLVGKSAPVFLDPTCRTASIYGRWRVVERYHCSYGLNPAYRGAIERAGLHVVGEDDHGDARVIELPGHPFFIATLFQPQLESAAGAPAPLVRALVDAAIHHRDHRPTPSGSHAIPVA